MNAREFLTHDQIAKNAPSILAAAPRTGLSEKYGFIPTIDLIGAMAGEGWRPVQVSQKRSRTEDRLMVAKHLIRFGHPDSTALRGGLHPEIIAVNSHDGSSSWQISAGLFRMACANGLIIADATFASIKLRHSIGVIELAQEATRNVVNAIPQLSQRVEQFMTRELSYGEQMNFAVKALELKFGKVSPITSGQLLTRHREEDAGNDLWTTFNVVQENLMRGGLVGAARTGRRHTTRAIRDLNIDLKLNRGLWELAEAA